MNEEEKTINSDNEAYYRILLQTVKEVSRFHLIREMDTYKQLSHFFLFKHKDWREEFNEFGKQKISRTISEKYRKVFKDFTEAEFWWALLTDPQYNPNNKSILLEDWWRWVIKNGTVYTSQRAKERLERLYSIYEKEKQAENEKKQQTETTKTIDRDAYLLTLFNNSEAIYDKFYEWCKDKKGVAIVKDLVGAIRATLNHNTTTNDYLYKKGVKIIEIHTACKSIGLEVAGYQAFRDALRRTDGDKLKLQNEIEEKTQEYKKILPQKL